MSEKAESPVGLAISKRLRAIKKRVGKAEQIEQQVAAGKAINADQEETMKSKAGCIGAIEELTKLESILKEAVAEEVQHAKEAWIAEEEKRREKEEEARAAEKVAEVEQEAEQAVVEAADPEASRDSIIEDAVQQLVPLIYFSKMFDLSYAQLVSESPLEREACMQRLMQDESVKKQERFACYSWVNQASPRDELKHQDMDLIVQFGKLLTGRPAGQLISHEMAVQRCCELARQFLLKNGDLLPDLGIDGESPPTGAYLCEQVAKIKSSEYFIVKPEFSTVQQDSYPTEQLVDSQPSNMKSEELPVEESSSEPAASAPVSAAAAPATPETWPYMLPPQSSAAGMPPVPVEGMAPAGQIPVSRAGVADQVLPGHPHPYAQPGMPINFAHPGGFIMPQHAGGIHHMIPPGAYDHMFQGMPYGMVPPAVDGVAMGEGSGALPTAAPNGAPTMAPGSSNQADNAQASGVTGARVNARQPGAGGDRGRGNRNRGGQRGGGGERGQDNRGRGGNRNRNNYDSGRGGGRGSSNRSGQQQQQQQVGAPVQPPPQPPVV